MAQDNTLGAPTEGLGQTVTFGLGQTGGVPQQQAVQRQQFRMAAQGQAETTSQALAVPEAKQSPMFATLMRLGSEVLKPKIEAATQEARMRGYRRAQEGEALQQIADEQPWYANLFGDTPTVDGARAYTAAAKAANLAGDIEAQMPELRKLEGREFDARLGQMLKSASTGDAATDVMFQQQVERILPTAINGWTKANVRYKQELAGEAYSNAVTASARVLGEVDRAAREGGTREQADTLEAALPLIETFTNPGIDPKLHDKLLGESIIKDLNSGNFAAYRVLKSTNKYAELSPETAFQIARAHRYAATQAKINMPMDFLLKEVEFKQMAGNPETTSEAEIVAKAQELNAWAAKITGDDTPYLGNASTVMEIMQFKDEQRRQLDAAERAIASEKEASAKAQMEQAQTATVASLMVNPSQDVTIAHLPADRRQDAFDYIRAKNPDKLLFAAGVQWKYGVKDKVLEATIEGGLNTALEKGDATLMHQIYTTTVLPLIKQAGDNGIAVASTYAGAKGKILEKYHDAVRGRDISLPEAQAAYRAAIAPDDKSVDAKFTKKIEDALTTNTLVSLLPFTDVVVKDPAGMARALAPYVSTSMPLKQAIAKAQQDAKHLGIAGGHYWSKSTRDTSIQDYVLKVRWDKMADHTTLDKAFEYAVDQYAAERNISKALTVQQIQDAPSNVPQFMVKGETAGGELRLAIFKATDMNEKWVAKQTKAATPKANIPAAIATGTELWE